MRTTGCGSTNVDFGCNLTLPTKSNLIFRSCYFLVGWNSPIQSRNVIGTNTSEHNREGGIMSAKSFLGPLLSVYLNFLLLLGNFLLFLWVVWAKRVLGWGRISCTGIGGIVELARCCGARSLDIWIFKVRAVRTWATKSCDFVEARESNLSVALIFSVKLRQRSNARSVRKHSVFFQHEVHVVCLWATYETKNP